MKLSELPRPGDLARLPLQVWVPEGKDICRQLLAKLAKLGWHWWNGGRPIMPTARMPWGNGEERWYLQMWDVGVLTSTPAHYDELVSDWHKDFLDGSEIGIEADSAYCSCGSANVVRNSVCGKSFNYCRGCGKERRT